MTDEFISAICNQDINPNLTRLDCGVDHNLITDDGLISILPFSAVTKLAEIENKLVACEKDKPEGMLSEDKLQFEYLNILSYETYALINRKKQSVTIFQPITIPSGICFDCPPDINFDIRPKSSCMKNGYQVIYGTCDEDYTYGVGVQVKPLQFDVPFVLSVDQKFAQCIFYKRTCNVELNEFSVAQFENVQSVKDKRTMRTGGFGSTGKK